MDLNGGKKLYTLLSFLPQQFIMLLSSGGAIHAMVVGHFADGIARSNAFLLADQSPTIILVIFHTWAMVLICLHGEPYITGTRRHMEWIIIIFGGAIFVTTITAMLIVGGDVHKSQMRQLLKDKERKHMEHRPALDKTPRIPWTGVN